VDPAEDHAQDCPCQTRMSEPTLSSTDSERPDDSSHARCRRQVGRSIARGVEEVREARTFSTGFGGSRLRTYWDLFRAYRGHDRETADRYYRKFVRIKNRIECELGSSIEGMDVLEIGSGQRFTHTVLFGALGARAVGIDMDYTAKRAGVKEFLAIWRRNGIERAIKTMVRKVLFDQAYYRSLAKLAGRSLSLDDVSLRMMDACALDLPDGSFDCVFSSSVFEHIHDVESATQEVARVLRPGGIAIISICLFCGISGGHHVEWSYPDEKDVPRKVPAWDHLRQNHFPASMYLNRMRERDYMAAFERHLDVVAVDAKCRGERYLSDEIVAELRNYGRDELLRDSIEVLLKNRDVAGGPPIE
jgi:SAM-dependent methyltransferase